ncbi:MAG: 50S ribosomal protein L11 methyltransferase [Clostridia bacterium]|nr:50S ribosomal protein L11 methyltransferase [Clostridia bacterium]
MNDWMQVKVLTTTAGADLVSEILLEAGSEGTMIEDRNDVFENQRPEGQWDIIDPAIADRIGEDVKVTGYYPIDENRNNVISSIASALGRLQALTPDVDLGKLEMQVQGFENEDWSESWKKSFKPIRLGDHIVICPGWLEYEKQPDDKVIEIDPGMAFGTGTHETTGMCAALIEKYVQPGQRVIDIGTGSGILAIVAAHMGAKEVLATDLDAVAVRVAAENAALNGFGGKIDCRCGDLLDVVDVSGDVVIANIIADVILMLAKPVRERIVPNGVFICSGIAIDRREDVRRALLENDYEILDEPVKGEWAAFAARKR